MSAALALLAAGSFALGSALQQRGTLATASPEGDMRFLSEIIRTKVWWIGALCQASGWILQALALSGGSLVMVQSLCTLSVVFALPAGVVLTDQHVDRRVIGGAIVAVAGIVGFVWVSEPSSGVASPSSTAWLTSTIVVLASIAAVSILARERRGAVASVLFASAAGICFAYQAAVTKQWTRGLDEGLVVVLTTWTTYALIASALLGFALQQSALKAGNLAAALASSNASTLVGSVLLGVMVFDEVLRGAQEHRLAVMGLLAASVVGVAILATPVREPRPAELGRPRKC